MTAVSYYYCDIDEGKHAEHSYMNAPYCPWCKVAELEKIRDAAQVARQNLIHVLCDPEGNACIAGSEEDRRIIDESLAALEGNTNER